MLKPASSSDADYSVIVLLLLPHHPCPTHQFSITICLSLCSRRLYNGLPCIRALDWSLPLQGLCRRVGGERTPGISLFPAFSGRAPLNTAVFLYDSSSYRAALFLWFLISVGNANSIFSLLISLVPGVLREAPLIPVRINNSLFIFP